MAVHSTRIKQVQTGCHEGIRRRCCVANKPLPSLFYWKWDQGKGAQGFDPVDRSAALAVNWNWKTDFPSSVCGMLKIQRMGCDCIFHSSNCNYKKINILRTIDLKLNKDWEPFGGSFKKIIKA